MTIRGSHYENVDELDTVTLPERAGKLLEFYDEFVSLEEDKAVIAEAVYTKAVLLSTTDSFVTRDALNVAVLHGLHILWLNTGHEYKDLARILVESWARTIPCGMIREKNGAYYITAEDVH